MIKPVDDKVVVEVIKESEKTTSSGFVIPGLADEKPNEAIVIAVGPGLRLDNGVMMIPDVKPGDKVVFAKYQGHEVKDSDGKDYLILAYRDIVAIVEESND